MSNYAISLSSNNPLVGLSAFNQKENAMYKPNAGIIKLEQKIQYRTIRRSLIGSCIKYGPLSNIKNTVRILERRTYHFELKYVDWM